MNADAHEPGRRADLPQDESHDPLIGKEYHEYEFIRRLGAGASGIVYLANYKRVMNRKAAIKYLELKRPEDARSVNDEVAFLAQLSHPRIVRIDNFFQEEKYSLIAMQYVSGGDLRGKLKKLDGGRLDVPTTCALMEQLASALDYIHAQDILHLDLKPENILMESTVGNQTPNFFLADFGVAHLTKEKLPGLAGTPRYMSPEQFARETLDRRADVYALGVILYELIVGIAPFRAATVTEMARQHRLEAPKPPSALVADLPPPVEQVILRALAKNPAERFESASALSMYLQAAATPLLAQAAPTAARILNELASQHAEGVQRLVQRADGPLQLALMGADGVERVEAFSALPIVVGRAAGVTVVLDDAEISRRHFQLERQSDGQLTITDLNSRNRTYLDGEPLTPGQPYPWTPAQLVMAGSHLLRLVAAPRAMQAVTAGQFVGLLNQVQDRHRAPRVALDATPQTLAARVGEAYTLKVNVRPENTPTATYRLKVSDSLNNLLVAGLILPADRSIAPGEGYTFDMTLVAPKVPSGTYDLFVGVQSNDSSIPEAVQVVRVSIQPQVQYAVNLKPQTVMHRRLWPRRATLTIINNSNVDETFLVDVTAHQLLRASSSASRGVVIGRGQSRDVAVRLSPQRGARGVGQLWYAVVTRAQSTGAEREETGAYQFVPGRPFPFFRVLLGVALLVLAGFALVRLANGVPPDAIVRELIALVEALWQSLSARIQELRS